MRNEGRDVNLEQVTPHVVHPGLHQDYDLDFRMWRVDDIAPTLTSPMLSGLISSVHFLGPDAPGPHWARCTRPLTHWRVGTSCVSSRSGGRREQAVQAGRDRPRPNSPCV